MRKLSIPLIAMLLLLTAVVAETEYRQTGGTNTDFLGGGGDFDDDSINTVTVQARGITGGDHVPLVADLDGNGINEIVVVAGNNLRLYQNATLQLVKTLTLPSGTYSPPIINDIDQDGFLEIIIANENDNNGNVTIAQFNGTAFTIQNTIVFSDIYGGPNAGTQEILLQCSDNRSGTEKTVCFYANLDSGGAAQSSNVNFAVFNATARSAFTTTGPLAFALSVCFPSIPTMSFVDYDNDARGEFVFTYTQFNDASDDDLHIVYVDALENLSFIVEEEIVFDSNYNPHTSSALCSTNLGKFFTAPMVADLAGGGGELRSLVGINQDADNYVMHVFDAQGSSTPVISHPSSATADGEILGNPMLGNVFGDTGVEDYCVFGQDTDQQILKLLCGSENTQHEIFGFDVKTIEFQFDISNTFNLSNTYNNPTAIAHMMDTEQDDIDVTDYFFGGAVGATNTSELITSHGVFQLTNDLVSQVPFNTAGNFMTRLFPITAEQACIVADVEQVGQSDIMCVSDNTIRYFNDNFVNSPAFIKQHSVTPCLNAGAIGVNTSMQVKLTGSDVNGDPVTHRVTLYEGGI